jgi:hypothetical protein
MWTGTQWMSYWEDMQVSLSMFSLFSRSLQLLCASLEVFVLTAHSSLQGLINYDIDAVCHSERVHVFSVQTDGNLYYKHMGADHVWRPSASWELVYVDLFSLWPHRCSISLRA